MISTGLHGKAVREGGVEILHHQHWQLGALLKVDPYELHHTRVMHSAKQLTLFCKPLQHGCLLLGPSSIKQKLVDLLPHTLEATKLKFLHGSIGAIPNCPPRITHSSELELPEGASSHYYSNKTAIHTDTCRSANEIRE